MNLILKIQPDFRKILHIIILWNLELIWLNLGFGELVANGRHLYRINQRSRHRFAFRRVRRRTTTRNDIEHELFILGVLASGLASASSRLRLTLPQSLYLMIRLLYPRIQLKTSIIGAPARKLRTKKLLLIDTLQISQKIQLQIQLSPLKVIFRKQNLTLGDPTLIFKPHCLKFFMKLIGIADSHHALIDALADIYGLSIGFFVEGNTHQRLIILNRLVLAFEHRHVSWVEFLVVCTEGGLLEGVRLGVVVGEGT